MSPAGLIVALLHPAARIGWQYFTVHWSTAVGVAALWGLYEWRARATPASERQEPAGEPPGPSRVQRASFVGGLLVMFLSLNGPLHDLSDYYLFSAHMVQHLTLTLIVPALRVRRVAWIARGVTGPRGAFVIFNVVIAAWHIPELYNTAMAYHPLHIVQHLCFLAGATIMWWPLMSPLPELPRLAYPGQMLYCFLMTIPMSIVAIYVALADHVLYPAYSAAPRLWGLSPLADQQLGGLIMWVPGGLFFMIVLSVVFFRWSAAGTDDRASAQVDWRPAAR